LIFLARNFELVKDQEKTYLTAASAVAATTLTVKAIDGNAWSDNDWVILGEIGSKTAEIVQLNGAVSDGTSVTIDQGGSGGARYAHSINEPLYRIMYNQVEFSRATTVAGTKTVLATNEVQPDDEYTRYVDTANSTGYGFVRFKNATTTAYSSYSSAIPYTGYTDKSLGKIITRIKALFPKGSLSEVDDDDIVDAVNDKQRDIAHERLWPFYETIFSDSRVEYQRAYTINDGVVVGKNHTVVVDTEPIAKIDRQRFEMLHWDTNTTGNPTHCSVWDNKLHFYPLPDADATATTLDGGITASATSITLASVDDLQAPGRILIEDEVISFEYIDSDNVALEGCERGIEGTTAAIHATGTAVTYRDIIYSGHEEPTNLVDTADETKIPDPEVLIYGGAMDIAIGKLQDQVLHDRFKAKYDESKSNLENKFGKKFTFINFRIKDKSEVVTDDGRFRDPNYPPTNLS
jgi:hypothetical protein